MKCQKLKTSICTEFLYIAEPLYPDTGRQSTIPTLVRSPKGLHENIGSLISGLTLVKSVVVLRTKWGMLV